MKIQLVEWKFKYKDEKSQTALCFKDYYTEQMKQKRTENNWKNETYTSETKSEKKHFRILCRLVGVHCLFNRMFTEKLVFVYIFEYKLKSIQ